MVDLTKYPNPLRLFTLTRDEWFTNMVESFDIPMHIFTAVRDTQLGQLMFAIETVRMKRKRSGEDPGPGLLEGENASMFVPLFSLIKEFRDFINNEELEIDKESLKRKLVLKKHLKNLVDKTNHEWFATLPLERLDEIYIPAISVATEGIIEPLVEQLSVVKDLKDLKKLIQEKNERLHDLLFTIYDPKLANAIADNEYQLKGEEEKTRIFSNGEEVREIVLNDYHSRVNLLYGFILELRRFVEEENYNYSFPMIEQLLTLEMLIMLPQADRQRIPLIKQHLEDLKKKSFPPSSFFEILSIGYQSFCQLEDANQRLIRKMYKNLEKMMKETSRIFWSYISQKLKHEEPVEQLIAVLWCHLRAIQSQAQYREQEGRHSYSHTATVRMEHIFWVQGRDYHEKEQYSSDYQFWSAYAAIANKQVRNEQDSLDLFNELNELLQNSRVLTNKRQRKKFDVNDADRYSILQRILSYGLESKSKEIFDKLEKYIKLLEDLLDEINEDDMHKEFSVEKEYQVVEDIRKHMGNVLANATS